MNTSEVESHNEGATTFTRPEKPSERADSKKLKGRSSLRHSYENIENAEPRQEKKRRRRSFMERSGMSLFRRSSSKLKIKPDNYEKSPKKMKDPKEKQEKTQKKARPLSAQSARSTESAMTMQGKMRVTWRDPNKQITKSGWLYKQDSTGKMKMWRKKWFVLVDFCLYYYKDSKEEEILGNIILPSYTVSTLTAEDKISRKYSFKVEHAGMRTYYLSADSYNDMAQWITALKKSCSPLSPGLEPLETATDATPFMEDESGKSGDSVKGKKRDSSESRKKSKQQEEDDSEFGFNRVNSPSSVPSKPAKQETTPEEKGMSANHSTNNNKYDPQILQKNGRLPSDSYNAQQSPKDRRHQVRAQEKAPPRRVEHNQFQQRSPPTIAPADQRVSLRKRQPQYENRGRPATTGHQHPGHPQGRPHHRQEQNGAHLRQPPQPQHKSVRRENGESAYFSDTSGATDSSRFANSSDRSNTQRGHQTAAQPQGKPQLQRQNSLVKLGNWVMNQKMRQQSGSNVNAQQRRHPASNFDTASEFSSVSQQHTRKSATLSARAPQHLGPPSSRRYRARTYNEYMDPMEVASSIISMPPLQHMGQNRMYVAQTLPRPQSSENVDKMGRPIRSSTGRRQDPGRRMVPSKSAGNIVEVDQYGAPISPPHTQRSQGSQNIKRAKSDYAFQDNVDDFQQQYLANFRKAQQQNNQGFRATRQQQRPESGGRSSNDYRSAGSASNSSSGGQTPRRSAKRTTPQAMGTPSDVFTPISNPSSGRSGTYNDGQIFRFETTNASLARAVKKNSAVRSPAPSSLNIPPTSQTKNMSSPGVEVKQVQKGQFRAFVLSARTPTTQLPPPERQTPLKASDNSTRKSTRHTINDQDIEANLQRLNALDRTLLHIFDDMGNLQADKERLEAELSIARSKLQSRYSAGSQEHSRQLDREQHQLEQELGNVKAQLANAAQKLKEVSHENEDFEYEIRQFKTKLVEELRNRRMLTDDVYNGVSDQDKESKRRLEWELGRVEFMMEGLNRQRTGLVDKLDAFNASRGDDSPLLSPITPPSMLSATSRSPRDVKRTSYERRGPQNRPSYSSTSSGGTPTDTPVKKYFTLPGRGVSRATSVDSVTADTLARSTSRPTSARSASSMLSSNTNLHRTKSAAERLFQTNYTNQASDVEAREMKRLQKEITRNRRNNLKSGGTGDASRRYSNPAGMTLPARSMKVGIDVQMALKHHRMPKVLQRAKRDMARAELEKMNSHQQGFDIDDLDQKVSPKSSGLYDSYQDDKMDPEHREEDVEPEPEIQLDVNLTHQLIAPDKVEIPERLIEYENVELSPAEEKMKHRKVVAIEKMLAKSGQQASLPAVHLAAALAVEAGSVARAVAIHASTPQRIPGDGQKENGERPVTDGSSSAGEEQDPGLSPLKVDPEFSAAYIV